MLLVSGCAMLMATQITVLTPPMADVYVGRGCQMTVMPVNTDEYQLDGKPAVAATPERARAWKVFNERFYQSVSNADPAHVARGSTGKILLRPKVTRVQSGKWFSDAAGEPTEVFVELEVVDANDTVLERLEASGRENASKAEPTLEDRLPQTAQFIGSSLGKYVRKELHCQ